MQRLTQAGALPAVALLIALSGCGNASGEASGPYRAHDGDRPTGPVADLADILPVADEAALDHHLRDYWNRTGIALIVVSVPSLEGKTIDTYAYDLFNRWGIGDEKTQQGLLLLVAPNERKVRIEVGCGLEKPISNAVAGRIIRHDVVPAFRKGLLRDGTLAGVAALEQELAASTARGPDSPVCLSIMKQAA